MLSLGGFISWNLSFFMAMIHLDASANYEPENSECLCALISSRLSSLKGAESLPISCLSCAPTAGNVRQIKARTSNSQINGRKEDRLKSATNSKGRQGAANHLCFGC
jgi:hypothetical protein